MVSFLSNYFEIKEINTKSNLKMPTLGPEVIGGGIMYNNEIRVITKQLII